MTQETKITELMYDSTGEAVYVELTIEYHTRPCYYGADADGNRGVERHLITSAEVVDAQVLDPTDDEDAIIAQAYKLDAMDLIGEEY